MRIVVADDAVILREGLARLLAEAGFEVVGLAGDADELCALVERSQPDVAIVDIRMPPTHTDEGLRAAKKIRARWPRVGILVLSQYVQARYAVELLGHGTEGVGYMLKDRVSDLAELSESVRRIGEGGSVLDPAVVAQLVGQRRAPRKIVERRGKPALDEDRRPDPLRQFAEFRERERQRFACLVQHRLDRRSVGRQLRFGKTQCHRDRYESLLRPVVQVALDPAPLAVRRFDQTRARSLQLRQPCSQLRLQARVLERQRGSGAHRLHELLVLSERGVMDQRRDRLSVALDDRGCPLTARPWQLHRRAARIDIASAGRNPVRELERGIAERSAERFA